MPFPLAHPAAVLPLQRLCPRWLDFPALVIGSVVPDFGYLFGRWNVDNFTHSVMGSAAASLVVGGVVWVGLARVRLMDWWMGGLLTAQHLTFNAQRSTFNLQHSTLHARRSTLDAADLRLVVLGVSLMLGAWTHVLLDGFTNKSGWFVLHSAFLQVPVAAIAGKTFRVCHVVWYVLSFVGVAWVVFRGSCFVFGRSSFFAVPGSTFYVSGRSASSGVPGAAIMEEQSTKNEAQRTKHEARAARRTALLVATMVLPLGVIHHLGHGVWGVVLVLVLTALLLVAVLRGVRGAKG